MERGVARPRGGRQWCVDSRRRRRRCVTVSCERSGGLVEGGVRVSADVLTALREHFLLSLSMEEGWVERREESEATLGKILQACERVNPSLLEPHTLLPLARLVTFVKPEVDYIRPLEEWTPDTELMATSDTANWIDDLRTHLLEQYDVPIALAGALSHSDARGDPGFYGLGAGWRCSQEANTVSRAFTRVYVAAGRGESVRDAMHREISSALTKKMLATFVGMDPREACENAVEWNGNPLHALRIAQLATLGADSWVYSAVLGSRAGVRLGSHEDEAFLQSAMLWVCSNQQELQEAHIVTSTLDYLCEMYQLKPNFSCSGRSVKKVLEGVETYQLSTVTFDDDEKFETNPVGIKGYLDEEAKITAGTQVYVPYEGSSKFTQDTPTFSVRIAEIDSLKRLFYEGEMLGNCLKDNRRSQVKYVSRVRQRVSSYWSMTFVVEGTVQFACLIEIWHLQRGNIIHQAEGPRPRTIPSPIAWYFLEQWSTAEGLDLSEWNCYS